MKIMDKEIKVLRRAEVDLDTVPKDLQDALKKQFPDLDFTKIDVLDARCGCNGRCYCPCA
jgi:hypothetical protein